MPDQPLKAEPISDFLFCIDSSSGDIHREYSQKDFKAQMADQTRPGYCLSLSVYWIIAQGDYQTLSNHLEKPDQRFIISRSAWQNVQNLRLKKRMRL